MGEPGVELMERLQQGDARALDDLISLHQGTLRAHLERYVAPADADDLLQDLWLRVWQRAGQWDGRGRPLAWLLAIATNLALNHLRRRRATVSLTVITEEEIADNLPSLPDPAIATPEEEAMWREQLTRLAAAVWQLSPEKRAALRLVRVEGHTLREAAALLGVPIGTLKSRLHHAHRELMEQMEEDT